MDTVGHRRAELAMTMGTLYSPQEALDMELVDKLVPANEVGAAATEVAAEMAKIPAAARTATKSFVRQGRIDQLKAIRDKDLEQFVRVVTDELTQQSLSAYLAALAKKSKR